VRVRWQRAKLRIFPIAALVLALSASPLGADTEPAVTINPVMTKGPVGAPVTIFEFSDYQ